MCYTQIRGDVLVENVLRYCSKNNIFPISIHDISNCGIYLENNLPGYVKCETDDQMLDWTVKACGYSVDWQKQINSYTDVKSGWEWKTLYPPKLAETMEITVKTFFDQNLNGGDKNIVRMKNIYAD